MDILSPVGPSNWNIILVVTDLCETAFYLIKNSP